MNPRAPGNIVSSTLCFTVWAHVLHGHGDQNLGRIDPGEPLLIVGSKRYQLSLSEFWFMVVWRGRLGWILLSPAYPEWMMLSPAPVDLVRHTLV